MVFSQIVLRLVAFAVIAGVLANSSSSQSLPVSPSPVSSPPARQQMPVENALSGEVLKLSPDQILLKRQDRAIVVLHLSPKTDVWSGLWVKSIPVQVSDRIYAHVKRRNDGSFDVQKMWVNLANLEGKISSLKKKVPALQLSLENHFLGTVLVNVDPRTQVNRKGQESPYRVNPVELHTGDVVRIIGRQMRDGSITATKLFLE